MSEERVEKIIRTGSHCMINEHVIVGTGSMIWHYCNIYGRPEAKVVIGESTQIGSYCEIKPNVRIGNFCRLQSYVFIPDGITIEDYVFIGPRVTFTNDRSPCVRDIMGKTCKIEKTIVHSHVSIGAHCVIGPGIAIGECAIINMGSVISKDIKPYQVVAGFNRIIGDTRDKKYRKRFGIPH